uniref:Ferric-chelate reductase 1 n=1 Tax=Haemonchus contortus TaxID=6289 RepID=A0A7I4YA55_HAECO
TPPGMLLLLLGIGLSSVKAQLDISPCGTMKGCLFAPPGCRPGQNCQIQFSYQIDGDSLAMELAGTPPAANGYVAVGFSKDEFMGDDMVVFCATLNGQPTGGLALNGQKPSNTLISNVGIQNVLRTSNTGGLLYCAINQRLDPNQSNLLNLNNTYQILLAAGPTEGNRLSYHQSNRYVMPRTRMSAYVRGVGMVENPLLDEGDRSNNDKLMIAHAILMVLSWSIFISTAILFARHMKGQCPNSAICGLQLWFHFHRTLNIIGVAGTIAGFVVVFVAKDWRWVGPKAYQSSELNNQWGSVHAMLGLIACVVAWAQPLNAVFRCHPDSKARILFNLIHGFFGFGCWLCAAAATMIAVVHFRMFSDRDAALGIYIAFIAVAGLTCIVMELLTFKNWWTGRHRVSGEIEMVRVGGTTTATYTDSIERTQRLQVLILLFFVVVAIGTAVAISVLIGKKNIA